MPLWAHTRMHAVKLVQDATSSAVHTAVTHLEYNVHMLFLDFISEPGAQPVN